jgi:choline dehydrogenase-like flavoprotein
MYYIVGSGPSGIAAAHALLARGLPVTMLDVGRECEPERMAVVRELARQSPEAWNAEVLSRIRGPAPDPAAPRKLSFGSDFPYAADTELSLEQVGTRCQYSFAKGGFSNVWGASVLPARSSDFTGWPVAAETMAPHYAAVAHMLGITGVRDDLETDFPFHAPPVSPPGISRQAEALLSRLRSRRDRLAGSGIVFGRSRLAIRTMKDKYGVACQHSGLCLTGCPYQAIWSAESRVTELRSRDGFRYCGGVRVIAVESLAPGRVRIHGVSQPDSTAMQWEGKAVFLACGPLPTAAILLRSLNAQGITLPLQYQPYFLLPLAGLRNVHDVASERLHTLAQLYLEIQDRRQSAYPVHLQLYTYNNFIRDRLEALRRWLGPLTGAVRGAVEGRMFVIQGYLDSIEAEPIRLSVFGGNSDGPASLRLEAGSTKRERRRIGEVVGILARHAFDIGAIPLPPLLQIGRPGEGNHIGGIFPMTSTPRRFETDSLGRLPGLPGVHLVDASVLPSLPSATYTYTIMANAHRIASEVAAGKID